MNKTQGILIIGAVLAAGLLSGALSLNARIASLEKTIAHNEALLSSSVPNYNASSKELLLGQTKALRGQLAELAFVFNPKQRWAKKEQDISILFVEDLAKVNQRLKQKAQARQVQFPGLGFPEKLPSETEAIALLSQLHGLEELLQSAIELGISVVSVKPMGIAKDETLPYDSAKTQVELSCPKEVLVEFLITLHTLIPEPCIDSLQVQTEGAEYSLTLAFHTLLVNVRAGDAATGVTGSGVIKQSNERLGNSIGMLHSKNPFYVSAAKQAAGEGPGTADEKKLRQKAVPRFYYRGQVLLKGRNAVAIEDTLNKETVFLGLHDQYGTFRVAAFSRDEVILESVADQSKTVIKKEE